ncbi:hypothetical protein DPMN_009241 [Dreissena polymorpha]|uniref:Uncharacterized protein n=1 Tax=Dreissena polymorpha TaxID=45954 RepID=A0A9D4MZP3_DREPO|nr:hypothetical protein DPMN_009241 [Dreissena polymorpha]
MEEDAPIPSKRPRLFQSGQDILKCIICQKDTDQFTTSSENGRSKVKETASIRNDCVNERLLRLESDFFVYHMSNMCYKAYTHKKSLDKIASSSCKYSADQAQIEVDQPNNVSLSVQQLRFVSKPRITINTHDENPSTKPCIVCAQVKFKGDTKKYRISECDRARTFLESALFLQDEVYTRVCDLQDEYSVFGAELFYHSNCMRRYLRQYESESCKMQILCKSRKREAFAEIIKDIDVKVFSG